MLDTNIVSYAAAGRAGVVDQIQLLSASSIFVLSAVTEAELRYGLKKKPVSRNRLEAVQFYLSALPVLHWTSTAALAYSDLRVLNESRGLTLANFDLMIAAHAVAEGLTLVTADATLAGAHGVGVVKW